MIKAGAFAGLFHVRLPQASVMPPSRRPGARRTAPDAGANGFLIHMDNCG